MPQVAGGIYNANTPPTVADKSEVPLRVANDGSLSVTPATGASFGASSADGSAFTQDTTTGGIAMGVYVASPQTLTTGDAGAIAVDVNRNTLVSPSTYAVDDTAMPATPKTYPISGEYRSSATTYTDGDATVLQSDVNGNTKVSQATLLAGEDLTNNILKVNQVFSFLNIVLAAPTTTTVKSGAGMLHAIILNKAVATGVITIYDNTAASGTLIATITMPAVLLATNFVFPYNAAFSTGLTIVTATAAQDITVVYR